MVASLCVRVFSDTTATALGFRFGKAPFQRAQVSMWTRQAVVCSSGGGQLGQVRVARYEVPEASVLSACSRCRQVKLDLAQLSRDEKSPLG
jgi:hypothetical protein